jgi:hypothetical protein
MRNSQQFKLDPRRPPPSRKHAISVSFEGIDAGIQRMTKLLTYRRFFYLSTNNISTNRQRPPGGLLHLQLLTFTQSYGSYYAAMKSSSLPARQLNTGKAKYDALQTRGWHPYSWTSLNP